MQVKLRNSLNLYSLLFLFLAFNSCSNKQEKVLKVRSKKNNFSIIFSHNINGETHPCGCRQFPLGGLPQVAGLQKKLSKDSYVFYVDSGDMLYPNSVTPDAHKESLTFIAKNLIHAQNKMQLKLFTPGDYDLAQGKEHLINLLKSGEMKVLITNLKDRKNFPNSIEKYQVSMGNYNFYFYGIINSDTMKDSFSSQLSDPIEAIKKEIALIKKSDLNQSRIIVLSHSGVNYDKKLAKALPQIDWIIGSHSQSFFQKSLDEGKTQIGQVLSRNHYLGEIKFSLTDGKVTYHAHEVSENLDKELAPNYFTDFIVEHKSELTKIQEREQKEQFGSMEVKGPAPTYSSCFECHKKQSHFWQSTAHSLALVTLHQNNESQNRACIGCHSLNFEKSNGFFMKEKIVAFELKEKKNQNYWSEFSKIFEKKISLRSLKPLQRKKLSDKWIKLDKKHKVSHNFSNVQCLNCHDKANDHPFEVTEVVSMTTMKDKCLNCHTRDQSPQWYSKNDKGLAGELNRQVYKQMLKKVSCPKGE